MHKRKKPLTENRPPFRALAFVLAAFFSFLFLFGSVSASSDHPLQGLVIRGNAHDVKGAFIAEHKQSPHYPFDPGRAPWEPEPDKSEKGETSDSFDDEPDKSFSRTAFKPGIDVIAAKRLLHQLSLSTENRKTVSLFILHHSWKSFLH